MRFSYFLMVGALLFSAPSAQAAVVSFYAPDNDPFDYNPYPANYRCGSAEKDGFCYAISSAYNYSASYYLHDDGGLTQSELRRIDDGRFSVTKVDISFDTRWFRSGSSPFHWPDPDDRDGYDSDFTDWTMSGNQPKKPSLWIRGYRNGVEVAEKGLTETNSIIKLGAGFSNLDYLEFALDGLGSITNVYFPDPYMAPNTLWCHQWCMDLYINEMTYTLGAPSPAIVPLPASGAALGLGLVALAGTAARRRKAAKR